MRMEFVARAAAAALVLAGLAACGGGGGGGGDGGAAADPPGVVNPDQEADKALVMSAVAVFDASTALDRVLQQIGYARLFGADGTFNANCAGGGTLQATKAAPSFVIDAANCKLATNDGFVVTGRWTLTNNNGIDRSQARWGYGRATERAVNIAFQDATPAGDNVLFSADGPFEVDDGVFRVSVGSFQRRPDGTFSFSVGLRLANDALLEVSSTTNRQTIQGKLGTKTATIRYGATGVEADIVTLGDARVETKVTVPWVDFVD